MGNVGTNSCLNGELHQQSGVARLRRGFEWDTSVMEGAGRCLFYICLPCPGLHVICLVDTTPKGPDGRTQKTGKCTSRGSWVTLWLPPNVTLANTLMLSFSFLQIFLMDQSHHFPPQSKLVAGKKQKAESGMQKAENAKSRKSKIYT